MPGGLEWWPFAAGLTVLGILLTIVLWRNKGAGPGLKALGITLLPGAVVLLGLQHVLWTLWTSVVRFVVHFVFAPSAWAGLGMGVVGVLMFIVGGRVQAHHRAVGPPTKAGTGAVGAKPRARSDKQIGSKKAAGPTESTGLEGMEDIEAILRKRGID